MNFVRSKLKKADYKNLLFAFILIQPFLDIFFLYQPPISTILKFSPATIIRIIGVGLIFVLFWFQKKQSKYTKWLVYSYVVLLAVYCLGHQYNASNFHSLVDGNFEYSIVSELFYIIRMVLPLMVLLVSFKTAYTERSLENLVSWLVGLVSGSIVITNILKISLSSYTNYRITGSIFEWFFNNRHGSYFELASKGFFNFANSTAAVEVLLLPILFYFFVKHFNAKNIILMLVQLLAMLMLGTKVATLGSIGILLGLTIFYLFFTLVKKELQFNWKILLVLVAFIGMWGVIYPKSPAVNRSDFDTEIQEQRDGDKEKVKEREARLLAEQKKRDKKNRESPLARYIGKNYPEYSISSRFIEVSYPYYYDPEFWSEIMKKPITYRISYRKLEVAMLQRVKAINNNSLDNWFGITYTRMNNIFNVERDFLSQYYSMGIIGAVLLVSQYLIMLIVIAYLMLRHFKALFTMRNVSFAMGVTAILGVSLYSGNVMDFLTATFLLAFFEGQLLNKIIIKKKKGLEKPNLKFSLLMPTFNDQETIEESLDSIRDQSYKNWELIIVDDGSTDQTKEIIKNYIKLHHLSEKVQYIYKENSDQLNSLLKGSKFITGDFVYIIHSDDTFYNEKVLERTRNALFYKDDADGLLIDTSELDVSNQQSKSHKTLSYSGSQTQVKMQTLWLGRNLFLDFAFWKKDIFLRQVKDNYLVWNIPNWLDFSKERISTLNLDNTNFEVINYRIHEGNYINSQVGVLNVLNGELRTLTNLLGQYRIPFYEKQYKVFRLFNKLKLLSIYVPLAFKKRTSKKEVSEILDFTVRKRVADYNDNKYLKSLVEFYKSENDRLLEMNIPADLPIYRGSDMRTFNQKLIDNKLEDFYNKLLEEMEQGFSAIRVTSQNVEKWQTIIKFLNISSFVELELED